MTTNDVQISAEYLGLMSITQLTALLVGATELNGTQAIALEAAGEQLRTTFDDHKKTLQRNLEYVEDNDELRLKNRKLSEEIATLAGELESTRNALDIRGRSLDNLHKQIEGLQTKLAALVPFKVGDGVRTLPGAVYRTGGEVLRLQPEWVPDGAVGVVKDITPDSDGDISVDFGTPDCPLRVAPASLKVIA